MSSWRRWLFRILAGLLVTAGIGLAHTYWDRHRAREELAAVTAQLDEADPGWRLEELEKSRREWPDDKNGALVVNAAVRMLPKGWSFKVADEFEETPPQVRLRTDTAQQLRDEMAARGAAVAASRKMANFPHGRFAVEYAPDFMSTLVEDQQNARLPAQLLSMDVYDSVEQMQLDRALQSIHGIFNIGRSLEDDPILISQLIRIALQSIALHNLERTLAHGEVGDAELARMQVLLTEEAAAEVFAVGMRGERAGMHRCLEHLVSGGAPVTAAIAGFSRGRPDEPGLWDYVMDVRAPTMVYRSNAWLLQYHTRILDAAMLPGHARYQALREIDADFREFSKTRDYDLILARLLAAAVLKIAEAEQRVDTQLHCGTAALAAERFRLKHDRWPKTLDELVAHKLLPAVPEDLYDGQRVRLRRAADGIVVYSIGKDGTYQGDALDRPDKLNANLPRMEFRLWDTEHRRQPPLAKKENEERDQ
jgi:hypothetical protein